MALYMASCDAIELDLQQDPNAVAPENAGIDFVYNNVQLSFNNFFVGTFFNAAPPARMIVSTGGFTYNDAFSPASYNGLWNNAYAGLFPDIQAIQDIAAEGSFDIHEGSALIMKAYVMLALVDMFGDVPMTEALQGVDVISPRADNGADIYSASMTMLDDAIALLTDTDSPAPDFDLFYDGDASKWITLANTLKLKVYLQTRLIDSGSGAAIASLVNAGDIIDDASEDFQFQYGTNRDAPNSRHPFYNNGYESSDATYQSNYFMWLLRAEKGLDAMDNEIIDPRIRFYFYRQVDDSENQDVNAYSCIFSDEPDQSLKPAHYSAVDPNMPYCIASADGYYGRDHMNGSGIPPDGPIRTIWGLYPGGGKFDDNSFDDTQNEGTDAPLGQGINPIMLSSFVYFMRAEAALTAGTGEDPVALMEQGIRASMDKVFAFSDLINTAAVVGSTPTGDPITLAEAYLDDFDTDVDDYVGHVMDRYNAAMSDDDRLDVLMKEYMIALYGNGLEAYNNLRRTTKPANIQPAIDTGPGTFIWSFLYPSNHVDLNANANQKSITQHIFWDTNSDDAVR